jgi:hypothetical protein
LGAKQRIDVDIATLARRVAQMQFFTVVNTLHQAAAQNARGKCLKKAQEAVSYALSTWRSNAETARASEARSWEIAFVALTTRRKLLTAGV